MHPMAVYAALHGLVPRVSPPWVQTSRFRIHSTSVGNCAQLTPAIAAKGGYVWVLNRRSVNGTRYEPCEWSDIPVELLDALTTRDIEALASNPY